MARKARIEIEGGLYHVITRGNDRQDIFHTHEDRLRFLTLLTAQKEKLPFFLYAFCLMTNHVHLLIERRADTIGQIMHRLLTGYSQYHNRRYGKIGHLFQGRHRSILCQSEMYMGELVRYIHLNPVRAGMVDRAEDYPYSSQSEYLGLGPGGIVDVDPVLRLFAAKKDVARVEFAKFVLAGTSPALLAEFEAEDDGRIMGSEEFVDSMIHRIGVTERPYRPSDGRTNKEKGKVNTDALITAVESVCGISRDVFCGPMRSATATAARDILIVTGRRLGATVGELSEITGLNTSNISRRFATATTRKVEQNELYDPVERVMETYESAQPPTLSAHFLSIENFV